MFDLSLPLMALALYVLIWEKLPRWGSWHTVQAGCSICIKPGAALTALAFGPACC